MIKLTSSFSSLLFLTLKMLIKFIFNISLLSFFASINSNIYIFKLEKLTPMYFLLLDISNIFILSSLFNDKSLSFKDITLYLSKYIPYFFINERLYALYNCSKGVILTLKS